MRQECQAMMLHPLGVIDSDRFATGLGNLQGKAAAVILIPSRRIGFGADLANETLVESDEATF
jgi:hypothetical protein